MTLKTNKHSTHRKTTLIERQYRKVKNNTEWKESENGRNQRMKRKKKKK